MSVYFDNFLIISLVFQSTKSIEVDNLLIKVDNLFIKVDNLFIKVDNFFIKVNNLLIKVENLLLQFKINWFYDRWDGTSIIDLSKGDNLGDNDNF